MATQMAGGKPRFGAIRKFADGGVVKEPPATSFRGLFNSAKNAISNALAPETAAQGQARRAAEYEAMKAKYGQQPAPQTAAPQPSVQPSVNAGLDGQGGNSVDKRLKEAGAYADGGVVKPIGAYRRGGKVAQKKSVESVNKRKTSKEKEPEGDEYGADMTPSDQDGDEGMKLQGPGTATSDSIDAQVVETGEPIRVANGERILSVDQDRYMGQVAKRMGYPNLDSMLEDGTGKPVGPTMKYVPKSRGARRGAANGMSPDQGYNPLMQGPTAAFSEMSRVRNIPKSYQEMQSDLLDENYYRSHPNTGTEGGAADNYTLSRTLALSPEAQTSLRAKVSAESEKEQQIQHQRGAAKSMQDVPTFACGGKVKGYKGGGAIRRRPERDDEDPQERRARLIRDGVLGDTRVPGGPLPVDLTFNASMPTMFRQVIGEYDKNGGDATRMFAGGGALDATDMNSKIGSVLTEKFSKIPPNIPDKSYYDSQRLADLYDAQHPLTGNVADKTIFATANTPSASVSSGANWSEKQALQNMESKEEDAKRGQQMYAYGGRVRAKGALRRGFDGGGTVDDPTIKERLFVPQENWVGAAAQNAAQKTAEDARIAQLAQNEKNSFEVRRSEQLKRSAPPAPPAPPVSQAYPDEQLRAPAVNAPGMPAAPAAQAGAVRKTTDLGNGITRIDEPGKSPLFTNLEGGADNPSNVALMNRGQGKTPEQIAQNQAALDNMQARQDAKDQAALNRMQYASEVASAQAFNEAQNRVADKIHRQYNDKPMRDWAETKIASRLATREEKQAALQTINSLNQASREAAARADREAMFEETNSILGRQYADQVAERQARGAIDRTRLGMDQTRLGMDQAREGRAAQDYAQQQARQARIDALQKAYENENDKDKRAAILENIRALSPNPGHLKDNFAIVGGGQVVDPVTGMAHPQPQHLIDLRTGKEVGVDQQKPVQPMPKEGEIRNGFKFKGGDVYDKTNWVKV